MQHKRSIALVLAVALLLGCGGYVPAVAAESGTANHLTWASSNEDVATVDANGVVTGIKAGHTTITVSIPDGNGMIETQSCEVYVTIPDGVYYIQNASSGLCLINDESDDSTASTHITAKNTSTETKASEFWKITYSGNGYYLIRPLSRLLSVLTVDSSGNVIVEDYTANSFVAHADCWTIQRDASGLIFQNNGLATATLVPVSASTDGSNVTTGVENSSIACRWTLGSAKGVVLRDSSTLRTTISETVKYIELDHTVSLGSLSLTYETYGGAVMGISRSSSNSAVVRANNDTGTLTGLCRGSTIVSLLVNIDGVTYSARTAVNVIETISVVNLYDSTIAGDDSILDYIDDAVAFLNTVYKEDFYLNFVMAGEASQYTNAVDECHYGANGACSESGCGSDCSQHHKNTTRIANELYSENWEKNHVIVSWSNSPFFTFCKDGHRLTNSLALVNTIYNENADAYTPIPVVQVLTINNFTVEGEDADYQNVSFMSVILAHEIAHTLGLKEIYRNDYGDDTSHSNTSENGYMSCIMEAVLPGSLDQLYSSGSAALCDYCRGKLHTEIPVDVYEEIQNLSTAEIEYGEDWTYEIID